MAVELKFAPEAYDAYTWYEARQLGLGEQFLSRLDACVQAIRRHPEIQGIVHEDYRRALVRKFPYAVFYRCTDDFVTVYCVFHTARDPKKWTHRLK